jgi:hypothetical protein
MGLDSGAAIRDSIRDSIPLDPIVFRGFDAVNSGRIIHFSWDVQAEYNGDHFLLEKSIDSCKTWRRIGEVSSIGDHTEMHTYEISEISSIQAVQECFRLTRFDKFGATEKLDSVFIYHPTLSNLNLIPGDKKAKESITVSCESLLEIDGTLSILDWEGELIYEKSMPLEIGYNRKVINLKGMKPGSYRVVVRNAQDFSKAKRLVVY